MPGLEVADGVIEAQGRTVQRVFVDGREFFGNDVMSAVRNIPADMVESIDVYNSQGDQSEFTGVDIGDGYTAINIVTQPDKRRGAFGRLFARGTESPTNISAAAMSISSTGRGGCRSSRW